MKKIIIFFLLPFLLNAQWIKQESGITENLTDVVMLDSVTAIAVGEGRSILRTSDAGKTWKNLTIMLSSVVPWYGVAFADSLNGVVVGDHQIRFTSDGGKFWMVKTPPYPRKFLSALYPFSNVIYSGADSGWIFHSTDTGKTWSAQQIDSTSIRSIFAWFNGPTEWIQIFAVTPLSLYTSWMVTSYPWEKTNLQVQGLGTEIFDGDFCPGGEVGFIAGVQGDFWAEPKVYRLKMFDTSWLPLNINIDQPCVLTGVSVPSSKVAYVCGTEGMVIKSTDGGDSWTKEVIPSVININAVYFFNESRGFAVGDSGLILYKAGDPATSVINNKENIPDEYKLYQNYPNPFNPTTKIRFDIPKEGHVVIKIFDVLGREVETLLNEVKNPGNYEVELDGNKMTTGVYFYQLKADNYIQSKKMILIN